MKTRGIGPLLGRRLVLVVLPAFSWACSTTHEVGVDASRPDTGVCEYAPEAPLATDCTPEGRSAICDAWVASVTPPGLIGAAVCSPTTVMPCLRGSAMNGDTDSICGQTVGSCVQEQTCAIVPTDAHIPFPRCVCAWQ